MQLLVPDLHLLALTLKCREGPLGDGTRACTGVETKPERTASNTLNFYPVHAYGLSTSGASLYVEVNITDLVLAAPVC
jgi:hypothetical protein